MTVSRKQIANALLSLVSGAYAWKNTPSRHLKLWSDVPRDQRPACFLFEGGEDPDVYSGGQDINPKRTMMVNIFVYTNANDPSLVPSDQLNDILDALDAAFAAARDPMTGRATLGGLVHACRIEGTILKDPGDIDGEGMLKVPVKIILP